MVVQAGGKRTGAREAGASLLVERESEVARIAEALESARDGEGSLVLIRGPAGIGKSALLDHAMRAWALEARLTSADPLESGMPLGVAEQILGGLFEGPVPAETLGEAATMRAIHLAYREIESLTASAPLLVAIDDAHWADAESLRMLLYVARRLEGLAVVLLLTERTSDETPNEVVQLLDRIRDQATYVLEPSALSAEGVAGLLREHLREASDEVIGACVNETAGSPLLVNWLANRLSTEDTPTSSEGIRRLVAAGADELLVRIRRLGAGAELVARSTALLGNDASLDRIAALAGLDRSEATAELGRLQRAGILADDDVPRFLHPLVRTAVVSSMTRGERAALSHEAARVLHAGGASDDRVALRLADAGGSDELWATGVLRSAAASAIAAGAPETAARYLRLALPRAGRGEEHARMLMELAQAEAFLGEPAHEERFEEALKGIGDPVEAARACARLADIAITTRHEARRGIDLLLRAIELLDGADRELESQLVAMMAAFVAMISERPTEAVDLLRQRIVALLADPPPEPTQGERMLLAQATMLLAFTMAADREACVELAKPLMEPVMEPDGPGLPPSVLSPFSSVLVACDEFSAAAGLLDRAIADSGEWGTFANHVWLLGARALVKLRVGDPTGALLDARDATTLGDEVGVRAPRNDIVGCLAALEAEGVEAADAYLHDAEGSELHGALMQGDLEFVRGRIALAAGDMERALDHLLEAGRILRDRGNMNPSYSAWQSYAALAALGSGDHDRACALVTEALELAERFGSASGIGVALRAAGLVDGDERGLKQLMRSVEVLEGSPAMLERAHSQFELGRALRRANKPTDARARLEAAVDLAHACRAQPLVEHGLSELRTLGLRPRRPAVTGLDALTPAELRTVRMAADGKTNKEIAQAHFLAVRTVESHLTSAYRKLQIISRDGLRPLLGS